MKNSVVLTESHFFFLSKTGCRCCKLTPLLRVRILRNGFHDSLKAKCVISDKKIKIFVVDFQQIPRQGNEILGF